MERVLSNQTMPRTFFRLRNSVMSPAAITL